MSFQNSTTLVAAFLLTWIGPFSSPDKTLFKAGSLSLGAAFQRQTLNEHVLNFNHIISVGLIYIYKSLQFPYFKHLPSLI